MAFTPLNKQLFRPWLSNCDHKIDNYSVNSIYKCLDVTTNQCLPSLVYNSENYLNFCGPLLNTRQCWTQLSGFGSQTNNNIEFNYNLMNILLRSRAKQSVPAPIGLPQCSSTTNSGTISAPQISSTNDNKHKYWFTKFKRQRPKRFNCPHCQIAFSNNGQLKGHIRTHTGERPFVCDHSDCGKSFTRNEELTRHRRIHTGIRPYSCAVCAKRFGRKDHLKKHQRTHEKRFYSIASNSISIESVPQTTSSVTSSYSSANTMSSFYNSMYFQIKHQF